MNRTVICTESHCFQFPTRTDRFRSAENDRSCSIARKWERKIDKSRGTRAPSPAPSRFAKRIDAQFGQPFAWIACIFTTVCASILISSARSFVDFHARLAIHNHGLIWWAVTVKTRVIRAPFSPLSRRREHWTCAVQRHSVTILLDTTSTDTRDS